MKFSKEYLDYLRSDKWDKMRKRTYKLAGYRCQICGVKNGKLQAHHNNYDREFGKEQPEDLIAVCFTCHVINTWQIRIRRLWYNAVNKLKKEIR